MKLEAHPALALRSYAWALIKANTGITEADYKSSTNPAGKVPVMPLSEEPEFAEVADKPIIVYGYDDDITNGLYVTRDGSITFVVKDENFRRLGQIINVLFVGFGRFDDAAKDINRHIMTLSATYDTNPFKGLKFTEAHVTIAEGGTPEESEGGRQSGMITVSFCCVADYNDHMKGADGLPMRT